LGLCREAHLARRVPAAFRGNALVKHKATKNPALIPDRQSRQAGASRRQILVVEPDQLTEWSLKTYLGKWFSVHSTSSPENAERVLTTHAVDVLVASDVLSPAALAALKERARRLNAGVRIVRMVTDPGVWENREGSEERLEKPFALAQLARLLGVSEEELGGA
jgi:DNA-binding NtrC family response regulator